MTAEMSASDAALAGSFSNFVPCFSEVTVSINIVIWGSEISRSLDGGAAQNYTGNAGTTGHNGNTYYHTLTLANTTGAHTFAFADAQGDGWHGGWWQLEDACGRMIGGGPVDGQVSGAGGTFDFTGTDESAGSSCFDCSVGQFSAIPGAIECTGCPTGLMSSATGATQCHSCPELRIPNSRADACIGCDPGQYPVLLLCFAEVTVTIEIVQDGWGEEISWSLDSGAVQGYTGGQGVTGDNDNTHYPALSLSTTGAHTFTYADAYGDGWHGGWWQLEDACGRMIGGGTVDGQVSGTGGTFQFSSDDSTDETCLDCPVGQFSQVAGVSECTNCTVGTYSATLGLATDCAQTVHHRVCRF